MMRRRAFTLPELLVSSALGALVLGILVALTIWGMRVYAVQSVENQRFQLGSLLVQRMRADLRAGCAQSVSVSSNVVAIQRLEDLTSDGKQVWGTTMVFYAYVGGEVRRGEAPCEPAPHRLSPRELDELAQSPGLLMLDDVSTFAPRLEGARFSLDLVTTYRLPRRAQPGQKEFQTSLKLRERP